MHPESTNLQPSAAFAHVVLASFAAIAKAAPERAWIALRDCQERRPGREHTRRQPPRKAEIIYSRNLRVIFGLGIAESPASYLDDDHLVLLDSAVGQNRA